MDRWSERLAAGVKAWGDDVAGLAVSALIDGGLVDPVGYERAVAIVSEEIFARLCVRDFPPREESEVIEPGT
jgi:hypothetical protein